jgi:DNA polymerase (family 10)
MNNLKLSDIFGQIADLLELTSEDTFRINSYRKTSRIMEDLSRDVADLLASGELAEVPGIGKGTLQRIEEYLKTGKITAHQELLAKVPAGLIELLHIPGLGPKTISLAWKSLGVSNLDDLKKVIDDGSLETLPGMGAKKVEKIQHGLEFMQKAVGRTPLGIALPIAEEIAGQLRSLKNVGRAEIAGSARRRCETIGDIDILVQAGDGEKVLEEFVQFPRVVDVLGAGATKASVRVEKNVQVDVRVVPEESFGAAWQYFTGSKAHNIRLRELAVKRNWKLNEYGLFEAKKDESGDGEKQLAGRTEEEIYQKFGLPWIPPELREDRGEIENANTLPKLIELKDIRGDFHMHTTASDGARTIDEMIEACIERGYEFMGISEHSKSSRIANGLDEKRLAAHIKDIRRRAEAYRKDITVFVGTEMDILADGQLDYDDSILAELDLVIASLHSSLGQSADKITSRLLRAMDNRYVRVIGHPTGRLLGERDAAEVDMGTVIKHAKETGTFLELNASWQRLDLKDVHLHQAKQSGVKIAIGTDAHDIPQLDFVLFGVDTARRGWLEPSDVINTLPAKQLVKLFKAPK